MGTPLFVRRRDGLESTRAGRALFAVSDRLVARFAALYPRVQIDFTLASWTRAMRQLHERTADIAIVTQPDTDDLLYRLPVGTTRYRAYVRSRSQRAGCRAW